MTIKIVEVNIFLSMWSDVYTYGELWSCNKNGIYIHINYANTLLDNSGNVEEGKMVVVEGTYQIVGQCFSLYFL